MLTGMRLRYDEVEDRIILKTTKLEGGVETELCLLITRRACVSWRADMAVMTQIAEREPQSAFRLPGAVMRKASGNSAANLPTSSPPAESKPRGSPAAHQASALHALVTTIECARRRADGSWLIKFKLKDHPTRTLVLSDDSLRRTASGLEKMLRRCNWAFPPLKVATVGNTAGNPGPLH